MKVQNPTSGFPAWCCQCPCPCSEPLQSPVSRGDPPTLAGSFYSVSCGVPAPFLLVLVCTRFCLCPQRVESLFPPVLWKSYNQIPLACTTRFPGESQSLCQIPRLGSLMWYSEPAQQWENFFGIVVLQFVGHSPSKYGTWFYHDCTPPIILLWLLFCLRMWVMSFWWIPASLHRWLFNSWLEFWCSHRKRWAHVLLLHHLRMFILKSQLY